MAANVANSVSQRYIIGPNNTRSPLPSLSKDAQKDTQNTESSKSDAQKSTTQTPQKSTSQTITQTKPQSTNDSLKFAGVQKSFNIMDVIPNTDVINLDEEGNKQLSDLMRDINALQIAKKSLSQAQSIAKDIKSNYKTEANDNFAPLNDNALRARYNASQQIKNIFNNAKYNGKNVFAPDFFATPLINTERINLRSLNLRDELSIDIFSTNLLKLSDEIESNIRTLQEKVDKIEANKWLTLEQLSNVRLEQKSVNDSAKALSQTPSLASALAEIMGAGGATPATKTEETPKDSSVESSTDSNTESNAETKSSTDSNAETTTDSTDSNASQNINSNAQPQNTENAGEGATVSQNTESNQQTTQTDSKESSTDTTTANTATETKTEQNNTESSTESKTADTNTETTNSGTTNSGATQATALNTENSTNNVVGVVSGDQKEQVVDLYM